MTAAAVAARERRVNELETRRFNYTLKEYIEFKYSNIFEEYTAFYKALSGIHPTKKDLLKTKEFKDWKKQTIEQSFQSDGIRAVVTDLASEDSEPCVREVSEESTTGEVTDKFFCFIIISKIIQQIYIKHYIKFFYNPTLTVC